LFLQHYKNGNMVKSFYIRQTVSKSQKATLKMSGPKFDIQIAKSFFWKLYGNPVIEHLIAVQVKALHSNKSHFNYILNTCLHLKKINIWIKIKIVDIVFQVRKQWRKVRIEKKLTNLVWNAFGKIQRSRFTKLLK